MIGDLFFSVVYWMVNGLINLLPPSQGFPPEALSGVAYVGRTLGMFSGVISTATLLSCLGIIFGVVTGVYGFRTLKWVISHLPFVGGRG